MEEPNGLVRDDTSAVGGRRGRIQNEAEYKVWCQDMVIQGFGFHLGIREGWYICMFLKKEFHEERERFRGEFRWK